MRRYCVDYRYETMPGLDYNTYRLDGYTLIHAERITGLVKEFRALSLIL